MTADKRVEENRRKERVALWSIAASVFITLIKGAAGLATGSLALIADAAHSLLDVAATSMTWLAVRAAHKPADEEHQYGHGKYEALAALALETRLSPKVPEDVAVLLSDWTSDFMQAPEHWLEVGVTGTCSARADVGDLRVGMPRSYVRRARRCD